MLKCDHFIYTSAKTKQREGYQVIAKTSGISTHILSELSGYLYPIGANLNEFTESRSLLILKNDVIFSMIRNIGRGYDQREGTLYNHSFVINKSDFARLNNDTRIFEKYFLEDTSVRDDLEKIKIREDVPPIDFDSLKTVNRSHLEKILQILFQDKKLALLENYQTNFIQNLLAVLPISMRSISFSTFVPKPDKQTEYELIQMPKSMLYTLNRTWKTINLLEPPHSTFRSGRDKKNDFEYLVELILKRREESLRKINRDFEKFDGPQLHKMKFLIHRQILHTSKGEDEKAHEAYVCATAAQHFDSLLASEYLSKAKSLSIESKNKDLLSKIMAGELALEIQKSPLNLQLIEKVLRKINERDPEIRNVILKKIFKKKKPDFEKRGHSLLKEALSSNSFYKDDILRLYIENKFLNHHIIEYLATKKTTPRTRLYSIIHTITKNALLFNPSFLKDLLTTLEINLDDENQLDELKDIVYDLFSRHDFIENVSPIIIIELNKILRLKIDNALQRNIIKQNGKWKWNSKMDFENVKYHILRILNNMSNVLENTMTRSNVISSSTKPKINAEKATIDSLVSKIQSVEYHKPSEEYSLPSWQDMFLRFWGLK